MSLLTINNCDLEFSEDDDAETGKGYYWQQRNYEAPTSQCFETATKAVIAMRNREVEFPGGE